MSWNLKHDLLPPNNNPNTAPRYMIANSKIGKLQAYNEYKINRVRSENRRNCVAILKFSRNKKMISFCVSLFLTELVSINQNRLHSTRRMLIKMNSTYNVQEKCSFYVYHWNSPKCWLCMPIPMQLDSLLYIFDEIYSIRTPECASITFQLWMEAISANLQSEGKRWLCIWNENF